MPAVVPLNNFSHSACFRAVSASAPAPSKKRNALRLQIEKIAGGDADLANVLHRQGLFLVQLFLGTDRAVDGESGDDHLLVRQPAFQRTDDIRERFFRFESEIDSFVIDV
jgi:hypothetical protein